MHKLSPEQIKELADKWLKGTITAEELEIFEQWYNQVPEKILWEKDSNKSVLKERIYNIITSQVEKEPKIILFPRKNRRLRIAVAAVFILTVSTGVFLLFYRNNNNQTETVKTINNNERYKNDLLPGTSKATLALGDGTVINLDSNFTGTIAQQGNTKIINLRAGQLSYNTANKNGQVFYNTITTPRGGQYQITLSDGSKVWLNAASSLRFPTAFVGGRQRVVELSGEGYFEVSKNAAQPYIVKTNKNAQVEVLGTHFNINSYTEEELLKTTLLEGKVKISNNSASMLLKPGQQAQLNNAGGIKIAENINTDEVVAWKNNLFYFKSADIKTIMRQAARWYDMDVEYRAIIDDRFNAEIPYNINASDFFKTLELTGKVKFGIEGKKVIVMQ